jgi:hypothetical protein
VNSITYTLNLELEGNLSISRVRSEQTVQTIWLRLACRTAAFGLPLQMGDVAAPEIGRIDRLDIARLQGSASQLVALPETPAGVE